MNILIEKLSKDMESSHLDDYWEGFKSVAYALFDENNVYLFNHPKMSKEPHKNYQVLKRDDQFVGCTLILYKDYPTAIVDLKYYQEAADLYSILIHELFHGFQYIKDEKRFPDDVKGVTYPLSKENIQLRSKERLSLYYAVFEKDWVKKKQYLATFVSFREKRKTIIGEYFKYETLIETIEGPAWYVELKAFIEKSQQEDDLIFKKYGQQLIDHFHSTSNIRKSCYSSGLFMCLLLDEFKPKWKEYFWDEEKTIYDLVKQLPTSSELINELELDTQTEELIEEVLTARKNIIEEYTQQSGIHLFIEGEITLKSFDPMNIIHCGDKMLHRNFLKIEINKQDYLIEQSTMAYCKDGLRNISKLHLILKERPIENNGSLTIEGIGVLKGKYKKRGKDLTLICSD